MSGRERERGEERDSNYRSGFNRGGGRGGFRGRGGSGFNKPRRYWDNDEYYKDDRDRGRRRRRSYSRSRSRSRSESSRSRSPPPRRNERDSRSRSPPSNKPEEYVPLTTNVPGGRGTGELNNHEPYVPSSTALPNSWELSQSNGRTVPPNPYGNYSAPQYQDNQEPLSSNNQTAMSYGYGQVPAQIAHHQYQQQTYQQVPPPDLRYPHAHVPAAPSIGQSSNIPPPPIISEARSAAALSPSGSSEKKKKDKRKKKKRHHSSSSSSSSSDDDSSSELRRRRNSKKDQSDSSSGEEKTGKKDSGNASSSSVGLTTEQKEALLKQREGYQTKLDILEREISKLQDKEEELRHGRADRQLIDENKKLQVDLKGRYKAVVIVLEKIDDVLRVSGKERQKIQEKSKPVPIPTPPVPSISTDIQHQPYLPTEASRGGLNDGKISFDYFDNKVHWCRLCNVFPESMEKMLAHFHSKEHHDQIQQLGIDEKPWHKRNSTTESAPTAGSKKVPFRGIQFFSPVQGWYCRLCNDWMGDPHCAEQHLKSQQHNSNYMGFLEEHPDWERKWVSDREKALDVSGMQEGNRRIPSSRFDDPGGNDSYRRSHQHQQIQEIEIEGKSIRVQMRNALKGSDEREQGTLTASPPSKLLTDKDSGLEEWMKKPKVTMDIIDTQKFAAIVRQKHGSNKEKEKPTREKERDPENDKEVKVAPAAPVISTVKEGRDTKRNDDRRQKSEKVELQISNKDNKDRVSGDRYRDRDSRNSRGRRSSPHRSRSRSPRDKRYGGSSNRRRSRSRSPRSRSRERSGRDRERGRNERDRDHHRERPETKEVVKKPLIIGKMPLYKRPLLNKDKGDLAPKADMTEQPTLEATTATAPNISLFNQTPTVFSTVPDSVSSFYGMSENSMSNPAFSYQGHSEYGSAVAVESYEYPSVAVAPSAYIDTVSGGQEDSGIGIIASVDSESDISAKGTEGKAKEDGAVSGTALPDDFQQALDIIYAVNPPPGQQKNESIFPPGYNGDATANGGSAGKSGVSEYGTDYAAMSGNGYGYMNYQPYQHSFDGYVPYEELDDGPPGEGPPGVAPVRLPSSTGLNTSPQKELPVIDRVLRDPPPPGDAADDIEDLRMLGIDASDTAVVK